jgi:hypothetical protein
LGEEFKLPPYPLQGPIMKAFFIDVIRKTVAEISIGKGIEEIYKVMECRTFEVPYYAELKNFDSLYCDEEARLGEPSGAFTYKGNLIFNHGLVMGFDPKTGESEDAKSSLEDIAKLVTFPENVAVPEPNIEVRSW